MKRISFLFSSIMLALLLCFCSSYAFAIETETAEIPMIEPAVLVETSGITGVKNGNIIRYEDFGLTVTIPESAVKSWESDMLPTSFRQLDAILETGNAAACNWADFETLEGPANFVVQILPCEENMPDYDVMDYYVKMYSVKPGVSLAERRVMQLGDNKQQNCFIAELKSEDGTLVNTLIFDRVCGCYRVECTVNTYDYQGAEELARQIFSVDAPAIAQYETSGTVGLKNGDIIRYEDFGLTVTIPESAVNSWESDVLPTSFNQLDAILKTGNAAACNWADFETPEGSANFMVQILPCEENMPDYNVMDYYVKMYSVKRGVSLAERRVMQLGEHKRQNCFIAELNNEDGTPVNTLVFDRICGHYRVECTVNTYGYQGAEELARQIFSVDAPVIEQYETSGTVGLLQNDSLRFEDYGVSVLLAYDPLFETLSSRSVPQTYEALAGSMVNNWYTLFWQDIESKSGWWSVSASLTEFDGSESDYIYGTAEYYRDEMKASECEIITLPLGENDAQKCLLVDFVNADGCEENLLIMTKMSGDYALTCSVSTYGWKGAKEKSEELFRVDKPKEQPFCIEPSGFLRLNDSSIFGKTVQELQSILGPFGTPMEFPWWGDNLSYFVVNCDGYDVWMLLDKEELLYGVVCENVEFAKFDSAFESATACFDNVYFYKDASENSFFLNDKVYQFYTDDFTRFQFSGCDSGEGSFHLSQRYLADPMTDFEIAEMADYIITGTLPELPVEHAVGLLEFAENHCGGPEQVNDISLCEMLSVAYLHLEEYDKFLMWREIAAGLGSQLSALVSGDNYYVDYNLFGMPMDCEKASEYYLAAIEGEDADYRYEAEDKLVSLWYYCSDTLSGGQLSKVEDAVSRIVENDNRYIPEVAERLSLSKNNG